MDTNSLEADPPDPLITVEPAPSGHRAADWTHARHFAPHPVAPPGRCPRLVRVRDRAVLYYPGTCGYHPWLPDPVLRLAAT